MKIENISEFILITTIFTIILYLIFRLVGFCIMFIINYNNMRPIKKILKKYKHIIIDHFSEYEDILFMKNIKTFETIEIKQDGTKIIVTIKNNTIEFPCKSISHNHIVCDYDIGNFFFYHFNKTKKEVEERNKRILNILFEMRVQKMNFEQEISVKEQELSKKLSRQPPKGITINHNEFKKVFENYVQKYKN